MNTDLKASSKNLARVSAAKDAHNATCQWGSPALEVHMHPYDIDRLGWEDGDNIAGLTLVGTDSVQPDRMLIDCAGDKAGHGEKVEAEITDAVGRELEYAGAGPGIVEV